MVKFPEATLRLFGNMYVCKRCKAKRRANPMKVIKKKVSCRNCSSKELRPISKGK